MAKKGYPGLVLVPPSDRTILRRRLLYLALFLIALIWGASTVNLWPPASDNSATCQPSVGQEGSNSSAENCGRPQSVTQPPANQSEFSLTPISQAESLSKSQNLPPSPTPDPDQLAIQDNRDQDSQPKSDPINFSSIQNVAPSGNEKSAPSPSATKPAKSPDVDVRLAEQGDAFAQYRLGRYYAKRDGRQTPESSRWYKKASPGMHRLAETGNGQAMYVLGVMYAYGRGVARNTEEARRWLTQAVERKITAAQPVLAGLAMQSHAAPTSKATEQVNALTQHH